MDRATRVRHKCEEPDGDDIVAGMASEKATVGMATGEAPKTSARQGYLGCPKSA